MAKFKGNPYYHPEHCGLETLATITDADANYSFDDIVLWRDIATGRFYMGRDSGCSCPVPFEEFHSLSDMTEVVSESDVRSFIRVNSTYATRSPGEVRSMMRAFRKAQSAHREGR